MQILFIQAIRGLAALLVVAFHSTILLSHEAQTSEPVLFNLLKTGDIGVDLFFIVSGFIMTYVVEAGAGQAKGDLGWLRRFLQRRFTRVVLLYWVFTLLAFAAIYLISPAKLSLQAGLLPSMLLIPGDRPFVLMVGWSLVYEIHFYFLIGIACYVFGVRGPLVAAALCCSFSLIAAWIAGTEYVAGPFNLYMPIYFAVGIALALLRAPISQWLQRASSMTLTLCLGFLLALMFAAYQSIDLIHSQELLRIVGYGPIAVCLFLFVWACERLIAKRAWAGLAALGDWSYSLYLSHWLVVNALLILISKIKLEANFSHIAVSVLVCVAVAYGSWRLLESPLLGLGKRLLK